MKKALLYTFAFLCLQFCIFFVGTSVYALISGQSAEHLPPLVSIAIMAVYSVLAIVLFLKMRWATASRSYVRSKPWDVLFWAVIAALGAIVPSLVFQGLLPELPDWAQNIADDTQQEFSRLMTTPGGYFVIALLPPVVEELVFRGAVLKSLLRWKPSQPWLMIAISALIFSLVHLNPAQMPHTFLVGLLLGWMYMRTGSIVPGVAYHWANNTAAYVMFHVYHDPQSLTDIVGPGQRPLLLALGFSLCILLPALFQLNLRMKKEA